MKFNRPRVPIGLPISAVICLILGIAAGPVIASAFTEEQLAKNVILNAIPFILIFASIILFFIILVWLAATALNNAIPERIYRPIEYITIVGIGLGIFGMFQPWSFAGYRYGFLLLFFSTLAFILWSHIIPKKAQSESIRNGTTPELENAGTGG